MTHEKAGPIDLLKCVWSKGHDMSQRERAALTVLILHADWETWGDCFPSQATIGAETGSNQRSMRDVLPLLQDRGLIRRTPGESSKGQFAVTSYEILPAAILAVGKFHRRQRPAAESAAYLIPRTSPRNPPVIGKVKTTNRHDDPPPRIRPKGSVVNA